MTKQQPNSKNSKTKKHLNYGQQISKNFKNPKQKQDMNK